MLNNTNSKKYFLVIVSIIIFAITFIITSKIQLEPSDIIRSTFKDEFVDTMLKIYTLIVPISYATLITVTYLCIFGAVSTLKKLKK